MTKIRNFFLWLFAFQIWKTRTASVPPDLSVPSLTHEEIEKIFETALNKKLNQLFNAIRSEFHACSAENAQNFAKLTQFLDTQISPSQPLNKHTHVTGFQPSCIATKKKKAK
jgi:hypothetical protein